MTAPAPPADPQLSTAEQLALLLVAYQQSTQAVRDQLAGFVSSLWRSLGYYDNAAQAKFVQQVVPVVLGAQQHMAALTAAHIAQSTSVARGVPFSPAALNPHQVSGSGVRNGTSPATVYGRPFHLVWRQLGAAKKPPPPGGGPPAPTPPAAVADAVQAGEDRAVQTALTDVQLAKTNAAAQAMAADPHIIGWRRALEGAYSCGLCIVASTQLYSKGRSERPKLMPIHPGCVPGDAPVSARDVIAVSRRWYAGELTVLTTAAGDDIRVTPNHPVLTEQGWVPAHLVREGDRVLRSRAGHGLVGSSPDEQHGPTLAEDVWRAAAVSFDLVQVPLAAEDFHGDGAKGEVDVVRADGSLAAVGHVQFAQPVRESLLVPGSGGRILLPTEGHLAALLPGVAAAPGGLVGGSGLSGALLRGHLGGAVESGAATSTRFDAPREEFSLESAPAYAQRGLDLQRRLSGEVEADRVVQARSVSFAGHVYNLHTAEGWYASGSHIVSNCDCSVQPVYENEDPAQALNEHLLGDVHAAIADRFGTSASDARELRGTKDAKGNPLMYRDLIVSHSHSELGPVLGVRGRPFTGPNDLTK